MKKLLFILPILLFCLAGNSQTKTKYKLPYDTVAVKKPDGTGYLDGSKGNFSDTLWAPTADTTENSRVAATTEFVHNLFMGGSPSTATVKSFSTVAALRASNFYLTSGEILAATFGCNSASDGGGGSWRYDATYSGSDNTGLAVKPTGVVGNGAWVRIYDGQIINVQWFGLIADGTTDNLAAWNLAWASAPRWNIAFTQYSKGNFWFPSTGVYRFSDSILIDDQANIYGGSYALFPFSTTVLEFANGKSGIVLQMGNPSGGSRASYVRNLHLRGLGSNTDTTRHGIRFNGLAIVAYVYAENFGGNGVYANTTVSGNASGSLIDHCSAQGNGLNGICLDGGESSAIDVVSPNCQFNGRCNIRDNGFLGSNIWGGLTAGAGLRTGYLSDAIVSRAGRYYVCKRNNIAIQPTVTSGWQDYWEDVGTTIEVPPSVNAWSGAVSYKLAANYAATGESQAAVASTLYRETGSGSDIVGGTSVTMFGAGAGTFNKNGLALTVVNNYLTVIEGGAGFNVPNKTNEDLYVQMDVTYGFQAGGILLGTISNFHAYTDSVIGFSGSDDVIKFGFTGKTLIGTKFGITGNQVTEFPWVSKIGLGFANARGSSAYSSIDSIRKFFYTTGTPPNEGPRFGPGDFGMYMKADSSLFGIRAMVTTPGAIDADWAFLRTGNSNGIRVDTTDFKPAMYGPDGKLYKGYWFSGGGGGWPLTGSAAFTGDVSMDAGVNTFSLTAGNTSFSVNSDGVGITNSDIGGFSFSVGDDRIQINDVRATPRGVQYAGDYSATFTARSLVDKAYVDGVAGGITGTMVAGRIPVGATASTLTTYSGFTYDNSTGTFAFGTGGTIRDNGSNMRFGGSGGWEFYNGGNNSVYMYNGAGDNGLLLFGFDRSINSISGTSDVKLQTANAAGKVGIGGAPDASAKLQVISTTLAAIPYPIMTTVQRNAISSPIAGDGVYCSDCTASDASTGVITIYNGSAWKNCW